MLSWRLKIVDDSPPAQVLLNQALKEDTIDDGYVGQPTSYGWSPVLSFLTSR